MGSGAKWFNSTLVERVNLTSNSKRKCEESVGIRKFLKVDVCEALERCELDPIPTPKCCIDESCENCTVESLSLMVSRCLIDSRRKLVPSMISRKNRSHLTPHNPFGNVNSTLDPKYGNLETKRPPPCEKQAKTAEKQPKIASFAQAFKPTNTEKLLTSGSDSASSQDGKPKLKGVLIRKSTKNLPGATKNLRQKPNSRRRKSLLTSEPSVGKQRLLSEFLSSGLVSTNEKEAGEDLGL